MTAPEESVQQLSEFLFDFCQLNRRQRVNLRNRTERLSEILGWKSLKEPYTVARQWALSRAFEPTPDPVKESGESFKKRAAACHSPKLPRIHLTSLSEDGPRKKHS